MAEENTAHLRPVSDKLPPEFVKIQCNTTLMPWVEMWVNHNGNWVPKAKDERGNPVAEPIQIDQVCVIKRDRAYEKMIRSRHIVRFAED